MHDDGILEVDRHSGVGEQPLAYGKELCLAGWLAVDDLSTLAGEVGDDIAFEADLVGEVRGDEELLERSRPGYGSNQPAGDLGRVREAASSA